jgi:hypothetical protein
MTWNCFHCTEVLALVNTQGVHPTTNCKRLAVVEGRSGIGGALVYCCLRCGALQMPPRIVLAEMEQYRNLLERIEPPERRGKRK